MSTPVGKKPVSWDSLTLFLVMATAAYAVAMFFHFTPLFAWNFPQLNIGSEHILTTHDAYHWLASAKGVGRVPDAPLALLASAAHDLTGVSLSSFALYAAPMLASLVVVFVVLWAWHLGSLPAGLLAAVLTVLAPGYFFRTRLGYYDTDFFTMIMPVVIALVLAVWLKPYVAWRNLPLLSRLFRDRPPDDPADTPLWPKLPWLVGGDAPEPSKDASVVEAAAPAKAGPGYLLPLLAGALSLLGYWFHLRIGGFSFILYVIVLFMVLLMARPKETSWPHLLWGAFIFALAGQAGLIGLALAILLTAGLMVAPAKFRPWLDDRRLPLILNLVLFLLIFFIGLSGPSLWSDLSGFIIAYLKPVSENATSDAGTVIFPSITQSVLEVQNLPLGEVLGKIYPIPWVAAVGLILFFILVILRPTVLLLLPLAAMGLLSFKLGSRTSMFGATAFAIGLAVMLDLVVRTVLVKYGWKKAASMAVQTCLVILLVLPMFLVSRTVNPQGVLAPFHAQALISISKTSPPNSRVWSWWDWGYPIQYFSERMSFADGELHGGNYVFPLGLIMVTPNFRQSAQLIKYVALQDYKPWIEWEAKGPDWTMATINNLGAQPMYLQPKDTQYVVSSVEDWPLYPWISYYGMWDIKAGASQHAYSARLTGQCNWDEKLGHLSVNNGPRQLLSSIDVVSSQGRQTISYPDNKGGHHLIIFKEPGQPINSSYLYLMDDVVYWSTFVQLLISDPTEERIARHFRLVYEGAPFVRVYQVL